jgi:hypothetical protein
VADRIAPPSRACAALPANRWPKIEAGADTAFDVFVAACGVKYASAAKGVTKDRTDLPAFPSLSGRVPETQMHEPHHAHRSHCPASFLATGRLQMTAFVTVRFSGAVQGSP